MGDGAEIGLPDELCVFGEEPAFVTGHWRAPYGTTRCQLAVAGEQVHAPVGNIDAHPITVADQCERAADRCLRRHMATQMPRVAPEKRPSVTSATFSPICWP